jgi:hypothetical protein
VSVAVTVMPSATPAEAKVPTVTVPVSDTVSPEITPLSVGVPVIVAASVRS